MNVNHRNGLIDVLRFIFSLIIVLFHSMSLEGAQDSVFKPFIALGGYISVEFFFVLSGFLMMKHIDDSDNTMTVQDATIIFIKNKIKVFYPYYIFSLVVATITRLTIISLDKTHLVLFFEEALWELLLVKQIKVGNAVWLNGACWYLSAMIICMLILFPFIYEYRDKFVKIILPVLTIFLIGTLYTDGGISSTSGLLKYKEYRWLIRAFVDISMGVFCFYLSAICGRMQITKTIKCVLTLLEGCMYLLPMIFAFRLTTLHNTVFDYLCLLFFVIGIAITFSCKSYSSSIDLRYAHGLAKMGLMIYLNHRYWEWFLNAKALTLSSNVRYVLFITLTVISSIVCMTIVDMIKKYWNDKINLNINRATNEKQRS